MAPIEVSVDIARPQAEVAYVTDPSRFAEWQAGVVGGDSRTARRRESARSA